MIFSRRFFSLPAGLPQVLKSNFIHLFWDIGWWGLYVGTTVAFLTIYAARSGASAQQIGLLSAIPALISMALSLPAGRLLKRWPARHATATAAFGSRILLVGYALLPWLLPPDRQFDAILVLSVIIMLPTTFINISYGQFFMESIPAEWRGTVVGARNAILSIVTFAVTILSGQILSLVPFPAGYQIIFFIGFLGAAMTAYHIWQVLPVADLVEPALPETPPLPGQPRASWLPAITLQSRKYLKIIGLLFLFNLINNMLVPLVPNLLVNTLDLSDAVISFGTGLANMLVFSVSLFMARITRRMGNRRATALGAGLLAFHALALALAQNTTVYMLSAAIGGLAAGVLNTAQYNYHLENVPAAERFSWLAWNLVLGNAAVLLGALLGPVAAQLTNTQDAILGFGILRLVLGLAILKWG